MGAFAPPEAGDPGQVGRYRIIGRLGRGGMGEVYLGRSPGGRAVAVKVVRAELAEDPAFRRRFVREVEAARRVTGFFTAAVVDADPEGVPPWLATEYVPGMSLTAAVAAHGPWRASSVLALGAALAEALEAVHRVDVVHRDLKPSNILLAADGPRVIDFGISLAAETTKITQTGVTLGTPGFMSPEQLAGDKVGAASDVFALGAVLAYAATGSGPFGSGSAHALNYRAAHGDADLTGLPPELANVVARCLAKDPARRPTVAHLVDELGRASQKVRSDGSSASADWLPGPVTAELTRAQAEAVLASMGQTTVEGPPPTALATARLRSLQGGESPPRQSGADGQSRWFTRGRALAGLAVITVLVVAVVTATFLPDRKPGPPSAERPSAPVLKQLWSYGQGTSSPPVVNDGTIHFGGEDGGVYALDADTGTPRWKYDQTMGSVGSLTVTKEGIYLSSFTKGSVDPDHYRVYALSADTGRRLWEFKPGDFVGSTIVAGGTAYFYSNRLGNGSESGTLYAVNAATGTLVWSHVADWGTALAVDDGVVYFGVATLKGTYLRALDAATGKQLWQVQIGEGFLLGSTSLTVAHHVIYCGADDHLYALDAGTGVVRWKSRTDLGRTSESQPSAVVDGVVYLSGNSERSEREGGYGAVVAADAASGKVLWNHRMPRVGSPPTVSAGTVHVGTESGDLDLLDAHDGHSWGQAHLADRHNPNVTVTGNVAYFDGGDGRLHAATITR
ncbi:serine/threonine-protein kinase [Streptomyces sp. NBC_01278]|uniref:serine/threonine-protein kinase n=1 Tax=Streptomyces sp. NBC_01278 TaxID=2903809 RepID=UPI002E31324C|nr:serine/threonine-protein kinase [Streptomyces sp. NBC_01278]